MPQNKKEIENYRIHSKLYFGENSVYKFNVINFIRVVCEIHIGRNGKGRGIETFCQLTVSQ